MLTDCFSLFAVDYVLDDCFQLISLLFLTVGRNNEAPATYVSFPTFGRPIEAHRRVQTDPLTLFGTPDTP